MKETDAGLVSLEALAAVTASMPRGSALGLMGLGGMSLIAAAYGWSKNGGTNSPTTTGSTPTASTLADRTTTGETGRPIPAGV